ncbi:MAG: hypothetical protein KAJ21_05785, partial [Thermoplasmatales archaeon]|nr:hypothetical protein [Thermoplasmatales archaeon]
MNELIITIFLSVIFTFIAFIISQFMMKWFKITNAKNRFGVLFIVMLTAFSVFSFTIITANPNIENGYTIKNDLASLSEEYSSFIMVVEETDTIEDNADYDKNSITNCYSSGNLESNSLSPYYRITTFIPNMSEYTNNILFEIIRQYQNEKSSLINQFNPNEEEIDISSNLINQIDEKTENEKIEPLFLFFMFNIFLIVISGLYLLLSFIFGKKLILNRYNAKKCRDPVINKIVQELLKELKIKKINIYLFNGDPNAFVFGLPASLAISTKLITCL